MRCKDDECGSDNLMVVGKKRKLVCLDCLKYQKFLSKADAKTFEEIQAARGRR